MPAIFVQIVALFVLVLSAPAGLAAEETASKRTYLKMMEVQEIWNEEDYAAALTLLRDYQPRTANSPYDQAVVLQYIAQTHVFMDQIEAARTALEEALQLPDIGVQLTSDLKLVYGQILLGDDQFEEGRDAIEYWYENTQSEKQPNLLFTLGYANYMTERMERAEELLAIAIAEAREPRESWYRIYYQVLFELRKYALAESVLLGMVERDPYDNDNWRLLANHHVQLEDQRMALAALTIAYNAGLLEGADDLKRMISLYGATEIPEKAARLLEQHLADGTLQTDAELLKRLANLWLLSRERQQAREALQQAAAVAPDGRTYELLGNIFFEDEDWVNAHESYLKAIDLGGFDEPERVYLLAGISAEQGGMLDAARDAFEEARKSDELRKQADALLERLDRS